MDLLKQEDGDKSSPEATILASSSHQVLLRRVGVVLLGIVAFPIMIFRHDRSRFYSYLHRMCLKTSDKPVWLASAEDTESMK